MIDIKIEKKVYLTPQMLEDALNNALKEQSIKMVEDIKTNLKSMGVEESGREIDSFQAKSKSWSTPLGGRAESGDEIKPPVDKYEVNIGSSVPYVAANEFGDGVKPPRPAVRMASHIDNKTVAHGYNEVLSKRLPK